MNGLKRHWFAHFNLCCCSESYAYIAFIDEILTGRISMSRKPNSAEYHHHQCVSFIFSFLLHCVINTNSSPASAHTFLIEFHSDFSAHMHCLQMMNFILPQISQVQWDEQRHKEQRCLSNNTDRPTAKLFRFFFSKLFRLTWSHTLLMPINR